MSVRSLVAALAAIPLLAVAAFEAAAQTPAVGLAAVLQSQQNDVSGAIRDLPAKPPRTPTVLRKIPRQPLPRRTPGTPKGLGVGADPVVQSEPGAASMPGTISNFEGVGNVDGVLPPDTTGDVGANHYVQWVNLSYAVYSKTGATLLSPRDGNSLWAGFGGPCESSNSGDPVVLYDHLADRWLLTQFALPNGFSGPFYQCLAVSQTGDPTGAYHRYAFKISDTKLNDYPKLGVWPDGYYMAVNQFTCNVVFCNWAGQGVVVFERDKMLLGQSARAVYWDLYAADPDLGGMLPADLDGPTPPSGTPGLFVQVDDDAWGYSADQLQIWELKANWMTPAASTFTRRATLPTAAFDSNLCGYSRNCIPQPGTTAKVDAISDRLMYRLQYRNFGAHQTLVTNHTVDVGGDRAGIRWYELRNAGAGWGIHQQGTYAPGDGAHRWMGSIAMDGTGGMALGMSVSSGSVYPSIRYTGRIPSATPGTMSEAESDLVAGSGVQTHTSGRWGDYSTMSVDPSDDCTFWYTQEYYPTTSSASWHTRIGSFRLPSCGAAALPTLSISDATVTEGNDGGTVNAVFTVTLSAAGTQTVTVEYATANGTASAGSDYAAKLGTLTFAGGATSQTITVPVIGDTAVEPNETFTVALSNPTNATIADGQGVGTIVNDDSALPPTGSITVTAPNGGETWAVRSTKVVGWMSSGISGNVRIELSRDGGGTWALLFDNTPNDGSQGWKVNGKTTTAARIRICTMATPAVCDTSNANFSITR